MACTNILRQLLLVHSVTHGMIHSIANCMQVQNIILLKGWRQSNFRIHKNKTLQTCFQLHRLENQVHWKKLNRKIFKMAPRTPHACVGLRHPSLDSPTSARKVKTCAHTLKK